jgi:hypothetical protein
MRQKVELFCSILTAIILWAYAALSIVMAIVAASWLVQAVNRSSDVVKAASSVEHVDAGNAVPLLLGTVATSLVIAVLCIFAWHRMRRRTQQSFGVATILVGIAFCITALRWFCEYKRLDFAHGSWIEPVFIWLPLAYVAIFAYIQSKAFPNHR